MNNNKRDFLRKGAGLAALSVATSSIITSSATHAALQSKDKKSVTDITGDVSPISTNERYSRIAQAQQLMKQNNISAMVLEPGPAMEYFSALKWWRSERVIALIIPQSGEVAVICPFFEEPSIRETLAVGEDVRVWQEHESPFVRIKQVLKDRGIDKGNLAFEHSVRYFVLKGTMNELGNMRDVAAEPVTRGCRLIKSISELQLMHKANEITLGAYAHVYRSLEIGMTGGEVKVLMAEAQSAMGGSGVWNMALINEASAYPHGTKQKQEIREGSVVLMDCGCSVHGYQSDISRTFVVGEPTKKIRKVWDTVRKGQEIAFAHAKIDTPAGAVDDVVRAYYQTLGYGPDYKLPGLSHRTGHGIGMKGHEGINFVHGEKTPLAAGMCFSNEPGIYLPGEFGVRLEDCLYMTEKGPLWFTVPPSSIEQPLGTLAKKPV